MPPLVLGRTPVRAESAAVPLLHIHQNKHHEEVLFLGEFTSLKVHYRRNVDGHDDGSVPCETDESAVIPAECPHCNAGLAPRWNYYAPAMVRADGKGDRPPTWFRCVYYVPQKAARGEDFTGRLRGRHYLCFRGKSGSNDKQFLTRLLNKFEDVQEPTFDVTPVLEFRFHPSTQTRSAVVTLCRMLPSVANLPAALAGTQAAAQPAAAVMTADELLAVRELLRKKGFVNKPDPIPKAIDTRKLPKTNPLHPDYAPPAEEGAA